MSGAEKRKHRRFGLSLPVQVRVKAEAPPIETLTEDISAGGLYLTLSEDLPLGSALECELTLPPELCQGLTVRLQCQGKIVRVERRQESGIRVAATIERYSFVKPV